MALRARLVAAMHDPEGLTPLLASATAADADWVLRQWLTRQVVLASRVNEFERCCHALVAHGAQPNRPDARGVSPVLKVAVLLASLVQNRLVVQLPSVQARVASIRVLQRLLRHMAGEASNTRIAESLVLLSSTPTRVLGGQAPLSALFFEMRLAVHDADLEADVRRLAPSEAEANVRCPFSGNTVLHWAVSFTHRVERAPLHAVNVSNGVRALIAARADPCAVNARGETPLALWSRLWRRRCASVWGRWPSAVHEVLEAAMRATSRRRLALAMAMHPRAASALARLDPWLVRSRLATSAVCVVPEPERSPQAFYASRLRCVLQTEYQISRSIEYRSGLARLLQRCILRRASLTPALHRAFQLERLIADGTSSQRNGLRCALQKRGFARWLKPEVLDRLLRQRLRP